MPCSWKKARHGGLSLVALGFHPIPLWGHTYLVLHWMSLAKVPNSQNIHENLIFYWRCFPREKGRKASHCSPYERNVNQLPDLLPTPSSHWAKLFSLPTVSSFCILYLTVTVASPKPLWDPMESHSCLKFVYPTHSSRDKIKLYCSRSMCLVLGWEDLSVSFQLLMEEFRYLLMDSPRIYQIKKACWGNRRRGRERILY